MDPCRLFKVESMDDNAVWSDDPLQVYLTALGQIPPLDIAEETACIDHVLAGGELAESAAKRLVEANLQFVVSLAARYRDHQIYVLDLIEKGNEGLMRAVKSLTDCAPESFSAHATPFIERALEAAALSVPPVPAHKR
jgi:DNA-directed RNA polymerase sigma subunit (sigma70/sigma32)